MKNKIKLRKGDKVYIITGTDKGKTGEILRSFPKENKLLITGINIITKHKKPKNSNEGGIVNHESKVNISNVKYIDDKSSKIGRTAFKFTSNGTKIRFIKKISKLKLLNND